MDSRDKLLKLTYEFIYNDGEEVGLPIGYRNYNIMQTVIMKLCFLFYN